MAKDKPRLARLAAIVTQLQSKQLVTARDIANKHQISIRTVYRDIRTLEQSGIPIITEEGRGYSIMPGYHLPPVMFTEAEALALITTEQLIQNNTDASLKEQYAAAVTKIKSILKQQQRSKTELLEQRLQVRHPKQNNPSSQYLIQLQQAITNFQLIQLTYQAVSNEISQREIEPFAIYTTKGNWILIAFCRNKQAFRAFRLDRIQQLYVSSQTFSPHEMTLEEYLQLCRKP